jgi:plastocyanin
LSKRLKTLLPQAAALAVVGALAVSFVASSSEPAVEITVRARAMAFYVDGDVRPNPVLELPAGQRVRLVFVNEDRGVEHDLVLPGLGVASERLAGDGMRQVLRFRTPARAGSSSYVCSLHPMMMTAALEIR